MAGVSNKFQGVADKWGFNDKTRLQRLYERLSAIPEGRDVVKLIGELDIDVGFRYGKRFRSNGAFIPEDNKLRINRFTSDEEAMRILAHEVRHAWQYQKMGFKKGDRLPDFETSRVWTRMIEGDARAFENVVNEKLCLAEGREMPQNTMVYKNVYEQIHGKSFKSGEDFIAAVPVADRMADYFHMTQISVGGFYDQNEYRQFSFDRMIRGDGALSSAFSRAMTLDGMRRICTTGLNGGDNYLAAKSNSDITAMTAPAPALMG